MEETISKGVEKLAGIIHEKMIEYQKYEDIRTEMLAVMKEFTTAFYLELDKMLSVVTEKATGRAQAGQRTNLSNDLQSYSFESQWLGVRIVICPIPAVAFPNTEFRIQFGLSLPDEYLEQLVGEVVLFLQPINALSEGKPFGALYIFSDGSWCGSGILTTAILDSFPPHILEDLSLLLLLNIPSFW